MQTLTNNVEKLHLGQPYHHEWNALVAGMKKLTQDKKDEAATKNYEDYLSHVQGNVGPKGLQLYGTEVKHCALTNCWAKDSWKLEISTVMGTASHSLWQHRISNDFINYQLRFHCAKWCS